MRKPFCYLCGRETGKLQQGLCEKCAAEKAEEASFRFGKSWEGNRIKIPFCSHCLSHYNKKWLVSKETELKKAVEKAAEDVILASIKASPESAPRIKILKTEHRGKRIEVLAGIGGKEAKLEFVLQKCGECAKVSAGYYEAIIQLRGGIENARERVMELLNLIYSKDRGAFVAREEKVRGGIDLYLGSAKAANKIARYFKSASNAVIKISPKLYGRKGGKNLYRITFLIRLR